MICNHTWLDVRLNMAVCALKFILLFSSCFVIAFQVSVGESEGECAKVDSCSCRLKNVNNTGLINLKYLVDGNPNPRFTARASDYVYYYNPCMNFAVESDNQGCDGVALCQKKTSGSGYAFNLGKAEDSHFNYSNGSVFTIYTNAKTPNDGLGRSSEIELICDESTFGRFEFIAEPTPTMFKFKFYSLCACPGRCKRNITDCVGLDSCTCEKPDGSHSINLHPLDNPADPMQDDTAPSLQFYYNPCSPIASPDCNNQSVCMRDGDTIVGYGSASSGTFETSKDGDLSLKYTNGERSSTVHLKCDESARDKPFFRVEEVSASRSVMTVYSVCACNGECACKDACKSLFQCVMTDSCSCEVKENEKKFSLHKLDNRYAPLRTTDNNGNTYYYNPCSGVEYVTESFSCQGVAGCQTSPLALKAYSLGAITPTNATITADGNLVFQYTGGDDGRSFDVKVVCDYSAVDPVFSIDGAVPEGAHHFQFLLITNEGCPQ